MIRNLRADLWGDRRVHAARLACLLSGHRFGPWSEPVGLVWRGKALRQRTRACGRCVRVEFVNEPVREERAR